MRKLPEGERQANWNNYQREWRANNKDKVAEYRKTHMIKKALEQFPDEEERKAYLNSFNKTPEQKEYERRQRLKAKSKRRQIKKGLLMLAEEENKKKVEA